LIDFIDQIVLFFHQLNSTDLVEIFILTCVVAWLVRWLICWFTGVSDLLSNQEETIRLQEKTIKLLEKMVNKNEAEK
jgi:hypothetical protein